MSQEPKNTQATHPDPQACLLLGSRVQYPSPLSTHTPCSHPLWCPFMGFHSSHWRVSPLMAGSISVSSGLCRIHSSRHDSSPHSPKTAQQRLYPQCLLSGMAVVVEVTIKKISVLAAVVLMSPWKRLIHHMMQGTVLEFGATKPHFLDLLIRIGYVIPQNK